MYEAGPSTSPPPAPSDPSQLGFIVLPGTPLTPNALAINDDGQFSILTRLECSIFTPKLGLQTAKSFFKQSHAPPEPTASAADAKGKQKQRSEVDCTRTTIVIERKNIIKWNTFSNEFEIGTPTPSVRIGESLWRDVTWSPTGLSPLGGCVLATLTTNHEVLIFEPTKQPNTGEWKESYDVSSHLVRLLIPSTKQEQGEEDVELPLETGETRKERATRVLECQATAIAWSPPVDGSLGDFSLLVLGHKSGHVSLWRRWAGGKMEILHRFRMDDRALWITSLEWSNWTLFTAGNKRFAMACLAVGDSNGSVWSLEITQDVTSPRIALASQGSAMDVDDDASGISAAPPVLVGAPDRRPVSQFEWIHTNSRRLLVYAKVGVVAVVEMQRAQGASASVFAVKDATEIELPTEGAHEWMGATSYEPCAGITYLPTLDALVVGLTSGCFYTIALDPRPALVEDTSAVLPTSTELTAHMRRAFVYSLEHRKYEAAFNRREVSGKTSSKTGSRVTGLSLFGQGGELGWLYEINRPDRMTYLTNNTIKTSFVVSPMRDLTELDEAETQLAVLAELLVKPTNSRLKAPLGLLRSFLHYVHDKANVADFIDAVLTMLEDLPESTNSVNEAVEAEEKAVATAFYVRLFGEEQLESLRLRETIARFIHRHAKLPRSVASRAFQVHSRLSRQVSKHVITRIGLILNSAQPILTRSELQVSGRTLLASASLELPESEEEQSEARLLDCDALAMAFKSDEVCPACKGEIALDNLRKATCVTGHVWDRCSITLSVIASTKTRTCMGCERKALEQLPIEVQKKALQLPVAANAEQDDANGDSAMEVEAEEEAPEAEGRVVNGMMAAATCCLHCGGRWMKFL